MNMLLAPLGPLGPVYLRYHWQFSCTLKHINMTVHILIGLRLTHGLPRVVSPIPVFDIPQLNIAASYCNLGPVGASAMDVKAAVGITSSFTYLVT